jgi:transcriptional regulator EpsA
MMLACDPSGAASPRATRAAGGGQRPMNDNVIIRSRSELDVLLVNFETAVRVKRRSDFFSWAQGVFQGILPHELLICVIADPAAGGYRFDSIASDPAVQMRLEKLCRSGGGPVYRLIELWEMSGCAPLLIDAHREADCADALLLAELNRLDLHEVLAHGVPDSAGRAHAFFAFSKIGCRLGFEHAIRLELAVPHLHAAWMRANRSCGDHAPNPTGARHILTSRELEILDWVAQGKSNSQIAQILSISHLTVKNHMQNILRKLDAHNRAQAAARATALNLTRPRPG